MFSFLKFTTRNDRTEVGQIRALYVVIVQSMLQAHYTSQSQSEVFD
jgi:hypothetical protein